MCGSGVLGDWEVAASLELDPRDYPVWKGNVESDEPLEFKYLKVSTQGLGEETLFVCVCLCALMAFVFALTFSTCVLSFMLWPCFLVLTFSASLSRPPCLAQSVSQSLTQPLSHALTQFPSHSVTQGHSVTQSLTQSSTHTATHSLTLTPPRSLTHSLPHSLTSSLTHFLTHSLPHSLTRSPTHSLPPSLPHSLAHSQTRGGGLVRDRMSEGVKQGEVR